MNLVPASLVNLIRGTKSNIESHIDVLTTFDYPEPTDISVIPKSYIDTVLNDDNFDKHGFKKAIQSVVRSIINATKNFENTLLDVPTNAISNWFTNIRSLNWDSTKNKWSSKEGIVSSIDLNNPFMGWDAPIDNFAIMKLQQPRAYKDENLLHEVVVGLIMNNMRAYLPCFMYTYGGIFCGYPTDAEMIQNNYSSLCNTNEIHTIIITEYIPGNLTLKEFIKNDTLYTVDDKLKVLLMIAFSLEKANKDYSYMHGDLHSQNIMIRTLGVERPFSFTFVDADSSVPMTINTRYVPIIIDYGRSSLKYNGYTLTPIEEIANNRNLSRNGGIEELWCMDGPRERGGDNCMAENLVFKGVNIPGFDFIRLLLTIDVPKIDVGGIGSLFIQKIRDCFYNVKYSQFPIGPWSNSLKGDNLNFKQFVLQTLSNTADLAHNPQCDLGFLNEIIGESSFDYILNPVVAP